MNERRKGGVERGARCSGGLAEGAKSQTGRTRRE